MEFVFAQPGCAPTEIEVWPLQGRNDFSFYFSYRPVAPTGHIFTVIICSVK